MGEGENLGNATLELRTDDKGLTSGIDAAKEKTEDLGKSMFEASQAFDMVKQASAFLGEQLKQTVTEFMAAEKVEAQMDAVLRATAGACGLTKTELIGLAAGLQETTTFSDDAIQSAENVLLRYTKIGKEVFPQATKSVLNMAAATGENADSTAKLIGKLMQDADAMTQAKRAGIMFTDEQIKMGKQLADSGRMAEYQTMVLGALDERFGGSAEAIRNTFGGALESLGNKFNNLQEYVGQLISRALKPVLDIASMLIDGFMGLDSWIRELIVTIAGIVAVAVPVIAAIGGIAAAIKMMTLAMATNPIMLIATAAIIAVTAIIALVQAFRNADASVKMLSASAKDYEINFKSATKATGDFAADQQKLYNQSRASAKALDDHTGSVKANEEALKSQREFMLANLNTHDRAILKINEEKAAYIKNGNDKKAVDIWYNNQLKALKADENKIRADAASESLNGVKQNYTEMMESNRRRALAELEDNKSVNKAIIDADKKKTEILEENNQKLLEQYQQLGAQALSLMGGVIESSFEALASGGDMWKAFAKGGLMAIAQLIEALGQMWTVQAVASFPNFVMMAVYGGAAVAAYIAAGLVKGWANSFEKGGVMEPGTALVGERGPELITVGQSSRIYPADETSLMLGRNSRGDFVMNIGTVNNDVDLDKAAHKMFLKYQSIRGRG